MTGVESRNENQAADPLVRFLKSPAVLAIPEQETPGIRAIALATPDQHRIIKRGVLPVPLAAALRNKHQNAEDEG